MTRPKKGWIIETPVWYEVKLPIIRGINSYDEQKRRTNEIRKWLNVNCGTDGIFWREKPNRHNNFPGSYLFRDEESAFLFKLIWL